MPHGNPISQKPWVINGTKGLYLDRTGVGWGLFTARRIAQGHEVLRFQGPTLTLLQTLALGPWSMYPIQVGNDCFIDCECPGAFVNHACDPSCAVRDLDHLVALRNLEPGVEITMQYSCSMLNDPERLECRCGSRECLGIIGNFTELPLNIQRKCIRRKMVSSFILDQLKVKK